MMNSLKLSACFGGIHCLFINLLSDCGPGQMEVHYTAIYEHWARDVRCLDSHKAHIHAEAFPESVANFETELPSQKKRLLSLVLTRSSTGTLYLFFTGPS